MRTLSRRSLAAAAVAAGFGGPAVSQRVSVEVWRDPQCGCCSGWVMHLRAEGFAVQDRVVPSVAPFRRMLGTPAELLSCHAGRVAGIGLEGHVPAAAVRRALADRPSSIIGLAVPAMPVGAPGMEVPGQPDEVYDVIAFDAAGRHVTYMRFRGGEPA